MARTLILLLRAAIACSAGAATWLTLQHMAPVFAGDTGAGRPGDSLVIVVLLCVFASVGLAVPARQLMRLHRPPPLSTAEVPGLAGVIAREDGTDGEGLVPALAGAALGSAVALITAGSAARPYAAGSAVVIGAIAFALARAGAEDRRRAAERHDRIERVRGHGTRTVAEVIETGFGSDWRHNGPKIRVTARFVTPSGTRTVTDDLVTEPADVPTPGGTVLVWYVGDGARRHEFHMEQDPDSIREPGAADRYKAPDSPS